jgi:hypothetical protein
LAASARFSSASRAALARSWVISRSAVARIVATSRSIVALSSATSCAVEAAQLLGVAVGVAAQRVGLAAGLDPYLGGLALGNRTKVAGVALRRRLHGGGLGPGLVGDLAALEARLRDDALGVALGLAAVLVGLLFGEAQDLLDPGAEAGQRRAAALLDLLALVGQLLLRGRERLLGLASPALRLVEALFGLGPRSLRLRQSCVEALDEVINLWPVVAPQDDREVRLGVGVLEERQGRLLSHAAHTRRRTLPPGKGVGRLIAPYWHGSPGALRSEDLIG